MFELLNANVLIGFVLIFVVMGLYLINRLKNRCYCIYIRRNKQVINKFVPLKAESVWFDKKKFEIVPDRATLTWKTVFGIFGTWVITYYYSWYSRFPHDPNNFENVWETPEVRSGINQAERMAAFAKGVDTHEKAKQKGGLMSFLPFIIIGVALMFIIYTIYTQGKDMTIMKQALQDVLTR